MGAVILDICWTIDAAAGRRPFPGTIVPHPYPDLPMLPWTCSAGPKSRLAARWRYQGALREVNETLGRTGFPRSMSARGHMDVMEGILWDRDLHGTDRHDLIFWLGRVAAVRAELWGLDSDPISFSDRVVRKLVSKMVAAAARTAADSGALDLSHFPDTAQQMIEDWKQWDAHGAYWGPLSARDSSASTGNAQDDLLAFLQGHRHQAKQQAVPFAEPLREHGTRYSVAASCVVLRLVDMGCGAETPSCVDPAVIALLDGLESLYDRADVDEDLLRSMTAEADRRILEAVGGDGVSTDSQTTSRRRTL